MASERSSATVMSWPVNLNHSQPPRSYEYVALRIAMIVRHQVKSNCTRSLLVVFLHHRKLAEKNKEHRKKMMPTDIKKGVGNLNSSFVKRRRPKPTKLANRPNLIPGL
jgi:hypothetical protein